jgi:hypothetical protein
MRRRPPRVQRNGRNPGRDCRDQSASRRNRTPRFSAKVTLPPLAAVWLVPE